MFRATAMFMLLERKLRRRVQIKVCVLFPNRERDRVIFR